MNVGMFNLERDHKEIKPDLVRIFDEVLSGGAYIMGDETRAFEEAFAKYIGVGYAVGVGNGTDAIRIGGLACGLASGDRIITTPNTYIASVMALSVQGIRPVLCDIEPDTHNMDPEKLALILEKDREIRVCIPVHLYGHAARMDEIAGICKRYDVKILEDACQAHGAQYKDKKVGSLGDAAAFSFYPTKNLGCYGDGGIVVTDSEDIYRKASMLRNYGQTGKHIHAMEGFNSRLDEIQAAILRYKLELLDYWNVRRRHFAWLYRRELHDLPITLPQEAPWAYHVYHLYVIRCTQRDELMRYLGECGITTLIHYPTPIHMQEAYRFLGYKAGDFPKAEEDASQVLSLPMYPSLKEDEVLYVASSIRKFYGK